MSNSLKKILEVTIFMKKVILVIVTLLLTVSMVACTSSGDNMENNGKNNESNNEMNNDSNNVGNENTGNENNTEVSIEPDVDDMYNAFVEVLADYLIENGVENPVAEGNIQGYMKHDLTLDNPFSSAFGLDYQLVEKGYFAEYMINVKSDRFAIIKAKDEAAVEIIVESLNEILTNQKELWETYLQDQ